MHAGGARSGRLPVKTTMSATEDAVAPFAVGPVGSADDWEALLARVQTFHGVSWQRRKDINDEDCELRSGFNILPPGEPFSGPAVDNYGFAMEHPEIVGAEFDRLLSKGYVCQWHES